LSFVKKYKTKIKKQNYIGKMKSTRAKPRAKANITYIVVYTRKRKILY